MGVFKTGGPLEKLPVTWLLQLTGLQLSQHLTRWNSAIFDWEYGSVARTIAEGEPGPVLDFQHCIELSIMAYA